MAILKGGRGQSNQARMGYIGISFNHLSDRIGAQGTILDQLNGKEPQGQTSPTQNDGAKSPVMEKVVGFSTIRNRISKGEEKIKVGFNGRRNMQHLCLRRVRWYLVLGN